MKQRVPFKPFLRDPRTLEPAGLKNKLQTPVVFGEKAGKEDRRRMERGRGLRGSDPRESLRGPRAEP